MKAHLKDFTGSSIQEQIIAGPNEMCDADVSFTFEYGGREVACEARIKQTIGSAYKDRTIEVYPVEGLPPGVEYDHETFAKEARLYYTERVVKLGGGSNA